MNDAETQAESGGEVLAVEIDRYLDAVETFRSYGCEPHWRPESPSDLVVRVCAWLEPCEPRVRGV